MENKVVVLNNGWISFEQGKPEPESHVLQVSTQLLTLTQQQLPYFLLNFGLGVSSSFA